MKYPKLRELIEAIKALIKGPYTSGFPAKPHIPEKKYRGKAEYFEEECVGCGTCAEVCPTGCIKLSDDTDREVPMRRLDLYYESCIFCGQCEAYCITKKGIRQSNKFDDLSVFDRKEAVDSVEKELALCEVCGCVVGAKDHLKWVAEKLGPLAYSSPTSYLAPLKDLKLAHVDVQRTEDLSRQNRVRVLCHKCRREITLNT